VKKKYPEPWKRHESRYYQFWWTDHIGKRRKHSSGELLKEKAREAIRRYIDGLDSPASQVGLTFRAYAEPFFLWNTCPRVARLMDEGKSIGRTHVAKSRRWLELYVFPDPTFSELQMEDVRRADLLNFRNRLRGKVGINTLNKTITTVKTILSEAAFRQDIQMNPGADVGNVAYEQMQRGTFTVEEVREILAKRPGDMASSLLVDLVICALLCTGCRVGELRALRWAAVDQESGRTIIREAFKSEKDIGDPKWGKKREIALPRILLDRLRNWQETTIRRAQDDFVFSTDSEGHPPGQTWLRNNVSRVLKAADTDKKMKFRLGERWLTPHACRHTLNTHLLAAGVPPLLVQTFLGWSSQEEKILTRVQRSYTELKLFRFEDVSAKIDELYGVRQEVNRKRA
jgi:integrase